MDKIKEAMINNHRPFYGVVRVTKKEPDDKNYALILIQLLNEYTEDYFNMKIALEKCA